MNIEITQADIARIGYHVYKKNDGTCFRCNIETAGIEEIFLQTALCTNGTYFIISQETNVNREEGFVEFNTNLPFDIYMGYTEYIKYNQYNK